jgi:hypothetical protein
LRRRRHPLGRRRIERPAQATRPLQRVRQKGCDERMAQHVRVDFHVKVSKKCTVALPVRKPNAAYRSREHLTERVAA